MSQYQSGFVIINDKSSYKERLIIHLNLNETPFDHVNTKAAMPQYISL